MRKKHKRVSAADRRRQIIQVAMDLFASRGFRGTTTRQIAQKIGVNEAIIFRHFSHKEDLYWAVIDHKCRDTHRRRDASEKLGADGDDREIFAAIAEDLLRRNSEDTTLARLLLFSSLENHRLPHRFFRTYVAGYYESLAGHIRRRMEKGTFRHTDPMLAARGFLGMVTYHFLVQELFGGKRSAKYDSKRASRVLTDIWLNGMHNPDGEDAHSATRTSESKENLPKVEAYLS
jgi:AcrR family transcriptional regulator